MQNNFNGNKKLAWEVDGASSRGNLIKNKKDKIIWGQT